MNIEPKAIAGDIPVYCSHDEIVDIMKVIPNPKNPNTHGERQIEILSQVIKAQGWRKPITVSKRSGFVVAGHGRLQAALLLKTDKVPVDYQDYATEAEEYADLVADNRIAELSEIDNEMLNSILEDIKEYEDFNFELTGYTDCDIDSILENVDGLDFEEDTEAVEDDYEVELPAEPKAKYGEIYQLGNHRLMCGDSTKIEDVEKLMDNDKAHMVFTDPPWNVNYGAVKEGNLQGYKPRSILNDFMGTEDFKEFMFNAFKSMNYASHEGAMTYVVMSAQEWGNMMLTLSQNNYHWSSTIIWNKNSLVLSRKDYHTKYEPIWYGWKEGKSRLHPLEDRKQSDVWDFDRPVRSEEHPTMKPIPLVSKAIINSSNKNDNILDLFGGSGTTLMACEQNERNAYVMELDPKYIDVIIDRWEQFTGEKAVLLNTNKNEVA